MDEGENSENSDEVERLLAGCTLRIPFQIIPLHSLLPSVKQSNGDCISPREGKRGNLTTPIRVAWRGLNTATSRGCCCHGEENQSEAQIGSVVVFKTLHHCGLGGGEGWGMWRHETAVSTGAIGQNNSSQQSVLVTIIIIFFVFGCPLVGLFPHLEVTLSQMRCAEPKAPWLDASRPC